MGIMVFSLLWVMQELLFLWMWLSPKSIPSLAQLLGIPDGVQLVLAEMSED